VIQAEVTRQVSGVTPVAATAEVGDDPHYGGGGATRDLPADGV
jgi:hypothetical protein